MPEFDLTKLLEAEHINVNLARFYNDYIGNHPELVRGKPRPGCPPLLHEDTNFFSRLDQLNWWHALGEIDGYAMDTSGLLGHEKDSLSVRGKRREWARKHFTHDELQFILEVCVGFALFDRGYDRDQMISTLGHTFLYHQLFQNRGSIFKEVATEDLKLRLEQGMFYEELPHSCRNFIIYNSLTDYEHSPVSNEIRVYLDKVLSNPAEYPHVFNPKFARKGIQMFRSSQNAIDSCFGTHNVIHLDFLTEPALQRYMFFIDALDQSGLTEQEIAYLLQPFVNTFIKRGNFDELVPLLRNPLVKKLKGNPWIQKGIAITLLRYQIYEGAQQIHPEAGLSTNYKVPQQWKDAECIISAFGRGYKQGIISTTEELLKDLFHNTRLYDFLDYERTSMWLNTIKPKQRIAVLH